MSTTPTIAELTTELEVIRRVNADLLTKRQKNKDRIATLEAEKAELQTKLTASEQRIKQVAVERPMLRLLRDSSPVPDVLQDRLAKSYRFEATDDGELTLVNISDGTPAIADKDGKAIAVDSTRLREFLTKGHADAAVYRHLVLGSGASGGGAMGTARDHGLPASEPDEPAAKAPIRPFGLR